jgi:hypothetical protein
VTALVIGLAAFWLCAAAGAAGAWLLRRRTSLSVKNLYLAGGIAAAACGALTFAREWDDLLVVAPPAAAPTTGALIGRRWRLSDLGAGDELREHELRRRWIWQPPPKRHPGERIYIRSQGARVSRFTGRRRPTLVGLA